jgi:curved DNA-binding protein CbpA
MKTRLWHPDRNQGDEQAEAKFKEISEAYQVLFDEEKRAFYDRHGRESTIQKEQGNFVDPKELFQHMFGGGRFAEIFGSIGTFDVMFDQEQQQQVGEAGAGTQADQQQAEEMQRAIVERQRERVVPLAVMLLSRLEMYNSDEVTFRRTLTEEAASLLDAPAGAELLQLVAYVYIQEAKQHDGGFLGLSGVWAEIAESTHSFGAKVSLISSAVRAQQAVEIMQKEDATDEQRAEAERQANQTNMEALWKLGKLEIEGTTRLVLESVLGDKQITRSERKRRCQGVRAIGQLYRQIANAKLKQKRAEKKANPDAEEHQWPPTSK